ncbi:MAG: EamA family transporter [Stenomitos rutilans HA7619-LM2]|nr:EamA family transporter [Stenomitos rutilans HA7619-LM2]
MAVPELLAGVAFSAVSAIAYFLVLTSAELSVAGPASALVYIFSVLMGHFWFKEAVPLAHLAGLSLIVCGVVLVSSKA